MNITVRVLTKQATAMLAGLEGQLKTTGRAASAAGTAAATSRWTAATQSILKFGNGLQWAGYQLSRAFTIPLLAAGGAALKYELDNEKAMAGLQKVYGDTALKMSIGTKGMQRELRALRQEFVALSDTFGMSQTDVINIAESWAAAGVSGQALGTAVKETMKTMVIGDIDAATATKALIAIQAQFGLSTQGLVRVINTLNTTENITGATMGDLIVAFQRSAGVAAAAGVDYKHLAAFISALVPAAGTATQAGNSLKTIFTDILAPTQKAESALKAMGIAVNKQSWEALNGSQRMELLAQKYMKLDGQQKVLASDYVFGKYQISRFNQAMVDISKSFDKNGKYLGDNSKALGYYGKTLVATKDNTNTAAVAQRELQTVLSSNPQKLKQMWTILKNDAGKAMAQMVPFVIQLVTMLAGLMHAFGQLSPTTQKWIGILVLGLAILGPFLLYISALIKLGYGLTKVFGGLGKMIGWFFRLFMTSEATKAAAVVEETAASQEEVYRIYSVTSGRLRKLNEEELLAYQAAQQKRMQAAAAAQAKITSTAVAAADKDIATATAAAKQISTTYSLAGAEIVDSQLELPRVAGSVAEAIATSYDLAAEQNIAAWNAVSKVFARNAEQIAAEGAAASTTLTRVFVAGAETTAMAWATATGVMDRAVELNAMLTAQAAAEKVAAEAAAVEATLANVGAMRAVMGQVILTGRTWEAAALLEARSVDAVTARLVIQMRALQALQVQYARMAQMQLTSGAAGAGAAGSELAVLQRGSTQVATYGAAAEGAAAYKVASNGKLVIDQAEKTATKTEGIFARSLNGIKGLFSKVFSFIIPTMGAGVATAGAEGAAGFGALGAGAAAAAIPVGAIAGIVLAAVAVFLFFRHQIVAVVEDVAKAFWWWNVQIFNAFKSVYNFIAGIVMDIIHAFEALPRAVVSVFQSVVNIIKSAAHQVYELFSYLNPFARHSPSLVENTHKGMGHVRDAHAKTSDHANKHAAKIANAHARMTNSMSAANSMVAGMSQGSAGASGAMSAVGGSADATDRAIKQTLADVQAFDKAIQGLIKRQEDLQRASDIKTLSKYAPGAIAEYRKLSDEIDRLTVRYNALEQAIQRQQNVVDAWQAKLDQANKVLAKQQAIMQHLEAVQQKWSSRLSHSKDMVDQFANAAIKGMAKYDNAIFKNTEAQNKLQLKLLKMQDANGSIDDARNKIQNLSAEMNGLQSIEDALQSKGAGSDVTGVYKKRIDGVQKQIDKNKEYIDSYDKLSAALDKLQRKGEELNLEKSLKFDKMQREIEQLTSTTKTLTFKQIIDGIKHWQGVEDENQKHLTDANKAVKDQQKNVNAAQRAVNGYQKILDKQNAKLSKMQDRYQKIGDAIQSAKDAIGQMTNAADQVSNALDKTAKSASKAGSAIKDVLGGGGGFQSASGKGILGRIGGLKEQTGKIRAQTKHLLDGLKDQFKNINLFGGLTDKFKAIGDWIKKWFWDWPASVGDWITKHTADLAKKLWNWIWTGLRNIPHYLAMGLTAIGRFFAGLPSKIAGWITAAAKNLPEIGKKIMYWIGYGIGASIGGVWRIIIGLGKLIVTKAIPAMSRFLRDAGEGLVKKIGEGFMWLVHNGPRLLWDAAKAIMKGFYNGVVAATKGIIWLFTKFPGKIIDAFKGAGKWLWHIGGDIISGLWNGLMHAVSTVWDWIKSFISGFIDGFKKFLGIHSPSTVFAEIGGWIIKGLLNGIIAMAKLVWSWLGKLGSLIIKAVGALGRVLFDKGKDLLSGLWNGIKHVWDNVTHWLGNVAGWAFKALGAVGRTLFEKGKDLLSGLWNGLKNIWNNLSHWLGNFAQMVFRAIGGVGRALFSKGKDLLGGLWDGLKNIWNNVTNWLGNLGSGAFRAIGGLVNTLLSKGKDLLGGLFSGIKDIWNNITTFFSNLPGNIARAVGDLGNTLFDKGRHLFSGLWSGIKKGLSAAGGWVSNAVGWVANELAKGIDTVLGLPWKIPQITIPLPVVPDIHFGPYTVMPAIPYHAKGGMTTGAHMAVVGDNPGGNELIMPMESGRTIKMLADAMSKAGMNEYKLANAAYAKLASAVNASAGGGHGSVVNNTFNTTTNNHYHFEGNLEFPNIKSGDDAADFVANLETWATGAL